MFFFVTLFWMQFRLYIEANVSRLYLVSSFLIGHHES